MDRFLLEIYVANMAGYLNGVLTGYRGSVMFDPSKIEDIVSWFKDSWFEYYLEAGLPEELKVQIGQRLFHQCLFTDDEWGVFFKGFYERYCAELGYDLPIEQDAGMFTKYFIPATIN